MDTIPADLVTSPTIPVENPIEKPINQPIENPPTSTNWLLIILIILLIFLVLIGFGFYYFTHKDLSIVDTVNL